MANDLSASAVKDIRRNIEFNGLLPVVPDFAQENTVADTKSAAGVDPRTKPIPSKQEVEDARLGKVRANEGDAILKMYMHRNEQDRFDCIDLDPYGSAVPFLDAAIGAVADGGELIASHARSRVHCTDTYLCAPRPHVHHLH